jgi:hypothetical protein
VELIMANNLTISGGTTIVLNENPTVELSESLQRIQINTLEDLVDAGVIDSQEKLQNLLNSAQLVTEEALSRRETFTPFIRVPGSSRDDLGRFGSFIAATPNILPSERHGFWRIARRIEPISMANITTAVDLNGVVPLPSRQLLNFIFNNIEVESNAVLQIQSTVQLLSCNQLLIRRTGRIVVNGNSLKIQAFSIAGEQ